MEEPIFRNQPDGRCFASSGERHSQRPFWTFGRLGLGFCAILCAGLGGCGTGADRFVPADGDLLFQDLDGGPLCAAIEAVTQGVDGAKFSHVGIAAWDGRQCRVIEAGGGGVKLTPLKAFLARSADEHGRPKVVVERLAPAEREAIPPALARAKALVGRPYDGEFLLDNGKYYCSELVYEAFLAADGGRLFAVEPMTFRPPGLGHPMPAWSEYFTRKGLPIPEGKLGCNPGGLSRSPRVAVVHAYGRPSGWSAETYRRHSE